LRQSGPAAEQCNGTLPPSILTAERTLDELSGTSTGEGSCRDLLQIGLYGLGAGAAVLGVILDLSGKNARKQAVLDYNSSLSTAHLGLQRKNKIQLSVNSSGIVMQF